MDRPELNEIRDSQVFRSFYYLLAELTVYCKDNGLPTSGGKQEISDRIAHFIDTGEVLRPSAVRVQTYNVPKESDTQIANHHDT